MTTKIGGIVIDIDARLAKLEANLAKADHRFSKFDRDVRRHGQSLQRTFKGIEAAAATYLSFQALETASRAIVETTRKFRQFEQSLKIVTGSAEAAAREMSFIETVAQNVGFRVTDLAQGYSQLAAASKGTRLEGEETRRIFEALVKAAAAYGLSNDQLSRVLAATQQIMSKGTLSAEEIRQQMGESLPGAFQTAAKAMGVTTAELNKMLQRGEVASEDFLPKFTDQLTKDIPAGTQAAGAGFNRFLSAYDNALKTVGNGGFFDELALAAQDFGKTLTEMAENGSLRQLGKDLGDLARFAGDAANEIAKLDRSWREFLTWMDDHSLPKLLGFEGMKVLEPPAEPGGHLWNDLFGDWSRGLPSGNSFALWDKLFAEMLQGLPSGNGDGADGAPNPFATILSEDTSARLDSYMRERAESMERANAAIERMGRPLEDITAKIDGKFKAAFERWAETANESIRRVEAEAERFRYAVTDHLGGALEDLAFSGGRHIDDIAESFGRLAFEIAVIEPLMKRLRDLMSAAGSGTGGGFLGSVISGIGAAFGGPRAEGGPVQAGRTYLVGERGPEMFTPKVSGAITANDNISGGGTVVVQVVGNEYFDARVAHVSGAVVAQAAPTLVAASRGSTMRGLTRPALPGGIR